MPGFEVLSLPVKIADRELNVRQVKTLRDRQRFIEVPWSLYSDDPHWVPPLRSLLRDRLSARKNPYYRHAEVACFLAEDCGQVVGRISAQVCQLVQTHQGEGTGHYGMFECENRPATAKALFDAAEGWLQRKGMTRMLGPFDLSINDEVGMLVDGFDHPPFLMMGHHQEYYADMLEVLGLRKEIDLYAYRLDITSPYASRIERIVGRASEHSPFVIQSIERKDHEQALRQVLDIFRDGWFDNWGYVPPTGAEVDHLINQMRPLLDRGLVILAEVDGETAGFMIVLPNLNEFIADLNGRLLPTGWIRLLWRLRHAPFQSIRVPLMGIRKRYQNTRAGAIMALSMIDQCRSRFLPQGVTDCEMSWILESNAAMRGILRAAQCEPYKCYRIFSKTLRCDSGLPT